MEESGDATAPDGFFATVSFNAVGDPFIEHRADKIHDSKGVKPFVTSPSKRGQTGAELGGGPLNVRMLFEGERFEEPHRTESKYRLQNTAKNILTSGFKYSSPAKVR